MTIEWRLPLSRALLSDPAFSSDPRAHPHFPLPFTPTPPPKSTSRRATMRALVRRLTSRHHLDRIDELDESDPFGTSYHHDGPYEATGATPQTVPRRSIPELVPRRVRPPQHQSPPASLHAQSGLSLHLEPGQILQHSTIYTSHGMTLVPNRPSPHSSTVAIQPSAGSQSPPNPRRSSLQDSSPYLLYDLHNRPSSFPRVPLERHPGDNIPNFQHDRDPAPYVLGKEITVSPPPRYESRLHDSGPLPQRSPPPALNSPPPKLQPAETTTPPLLPHDLRHKRVHSLDSSHSFNTITTQSASGPHSTFLDPPRIRHLPKRLVMPAPLQRQPSPPQHKFPLANPVVWQDKVLDHHALDGANYHDEQPGIHSQGPRLLRKRSSTFPEKMPIPYHAPASQDDGVPTMGTMPLKTANEGEGTKEKTRRRRLSKRKNDV